MSTAPSLYRLRERWVLLNHRVLDRLEPLLGIPKRPPASEAHIRLPPLKRRSASFIEDVVAFADQVVAEHRAELSADPARFRELMNRLAAARNALAEYRARPAWRRWITPRDGAAGEAPPASRLTARHTRGTRSSS